jgi:mycofactocin glycosyltransferase
MNPEQEHVQPKVSIIVCGLNVEAYIGECLQSIHDQTYPAKFRETIVVDDGSKDNTSAVALSYGARLIRFAENKGIPAARNAGLEAARGEYVAYIDSDCVAEPTWLETILAAFDDPRVVVAGGKVAAYSRNTISERYMEAIGYGNPAREAQGAGIVARLAGYVRTMTNPILFETRPIEVSGVYTANVIYREDALQGIGGFDERLRSSEDSDVCSRLRAEGGKVLYVPGAEVQHRHYATLGKVLREPYRRAAHMLQFYIKQGTTPPLFPMPFVYGLLALISLTVGYATRQPSIAAVAALLLPIVVYGWWVVRGVRERRLEYVLYPYIQMTVEIAALLGMVRGLILLAQQSRTLFATQQ